MRHLLSPSDCHTWLSRASPQQRLSRALPVIRDPTHILFHAHFLVTLKSVRQSQLKT